MSILVTRCSSVLRLRVGGLLLLALPGLKDVAAAHFGGELLRPVLARRGEADLVRVAVQFVDARRGFALVRALARHGIHLLGLLARIDLEGAFLGSSHVAVRDAERVALND